MASSGVVAYSFHEESVGKTLAGSKKWCSWRLSWGGRRHVIDLTNSRLSGKKKVIVDGHLVHEEKTSRSQQFSHAWLMDEHRFSITPGSQGGHRWDNNEKGEPSFELRVDNKPFHSLPMSEPGVKQEATASVRLLVVGASGLRAADWGGLSDPYCVCEIPGKRSSRFSTPVVKQSLDPVWNTEQALTEFEQGDSLEFAVFDKDPAPKGDDFLGRATLSSEGFYPFGFQGKLALSDAGSGVKAKLHIEIIVSDTPQERELRDVFDRCDANNDGRINKRELIKALRADPDVAQFLELPQQIRQEDGSRDAMKR